MKPSLITSISLIYRNLQEIGNLSIKDCQHPDPVLSKKFQDINKLAKQSFDLIDKNSIIKRKLKKI